MDEDEYGNKRPWVLESVSTDPTGLRVQVIVTVPPSAAWGVDTSEAAEFAQMTASRAITQIIASRKTQQERCPF